MSLSNPKMVKVTRKDNTNIKKIEVIERESEGKKANLKTTSNEDIEYLISFPQPIEMYDKDYEGSFSISDLYKFDDIYKVEIIVDTERINPFKLNHFKLSD